VTENFKIILAWEVTLDNHIEIFILNKRIKNMSNIDNYLHELFGFNKTDGIKNITGTGIAYLFTGDRFENASSGISVGSLLGLILKTKDNFQMFVIMDYERNNLPKPEEMLKRNRDMYLSPLNKKIFPKWDIAKFYDLPKNIQNLSSEMFLKGKPDGPGIIIYYITPNRKVIFTGISDDDNENVIRYTFKNGVYLNGKYTYYKKNDNFAYFVPGDVNIKVQR
jgi:hypothetical protein